MNPQAVEREPGRGPQSSLVKTWHWLDEHVEYWLNFFFYSVLTGIIVIEVFRRYVLNSSTVYGEEVARYAFIWLAYIATARGVRNRSHLSIEILRGRMRRTGKFVLYMVSDLCFLALAAILVVTSIRMVASGIQFDQRMTGGDMPIWIATAAIPVAWSLIGLRVIQRSLVTIRNFRSGRPIEAGAMVPVE